jgi:hypothetical protein
MQRFVSCLDQVQRSLVAAKGLFGFLLLALVVAGCESKTPKAGNPPATSDAPASRETANDPTGNGAGTANPGAGAETADESPAKADNPADVAALKAAGAQLRSSGGSVVLVDLSDQNGTDEILLHLRGLPALRAVILAGPSYSPEGLAHLGEVPQLKRLELEATRANDSVLAALKPLVNLELLKLFKTDVRDEGLKHLVALVRLKDLDLRRTLTSDPGVANLKGLENLKALKLQDTRVTEACLDDVSALPRLEGLGLSGTNFGDAAPKPTARRHTHHRQRLGQSGGTE